LLKRAASVVNINRPTTLLYCLVL